MTEALTVYGPLGIAVAGLSIAVVILYKRLEAMHDKREVDMQALAALVSSNTESMNRYADVLESFTERLPKWIRNGK